MFNNISEFLRRIDQFGASYKPSYAYGEVQYKTSLGGLLSIFLYGLSLAYLVYELVLWKSGKILPKVTSLQTEIETYTLSFSDVTIASFCLRRHNSIVNQIDPFEPSQLILVPLLYEIVDDEFQKPTLLLSKTKSPKHNTILIELRDIVLSNNEHETVEHPNREYMIAFQECKQDLLPDGWNCADQERITQFFNQKQNQLFIQTFVNQYNASTRQIDLIEQDYYAAFDNKTTYYSQISVCTSNVSVDTGFLLESLEIFEFPSSMLPYIQQMDVDYFQHTFAANVYIVFEFELGTLQNTVAVEYPKVSEVLANIGSIISFFLFFSHIAYMINEQNLKNRIIRMIIEMYYPQIKHIKFIKNFFGKILEVKYQDQQIPTQFVQKYQKLTKIAEAKLCLTNQIYEISRLQLILRSLCEKDIFKSCHNIGIKLKDVETYQDNQKSSQQIINNQELHQECVDEQQIDIENMQIMKIAPQATIDVKQQIVTIDPVNCSRMFLGNFSQEQLQDYDEKELCDEDFYVLMQQKPSITELLANIVLIEENDQKTNQKEIKDINILKRVSSEK